MLVNEYNQNGPLLPYQKKKNLFERMLKIIKIC